jgi:HK97 family phage major capsid protein
MKKISEQLEALHKTRAVKLAALQDLVETAEGAGKGFNPDQATAYDELDAAIKDLDAHATRLQALEDTIARTAAPIKGHPQASRNRQLDKGIGYSRIVQLIATTRGNDMLAQRMAMQYFPDMPDMARYFEGRSMGIIPRAATTPGTTQDPAWAGTLVYAQMLSSELIELVRAESILGQLPGLRSVPFNVRIPRETIVIGTAQWVGEGLPKPVGKGGYDFVTMPWAKAALIVAITEELARFSNPSAEVLMRDGLVRAIAQFLDEQLIGTQIAIPNVAPAGILSNLNVNQVFASSGTSLAAIQYDLTHAVAILNSINVPRKPVWLMSPSTRVAISAVINAFGMVAFPQIGQTGAGTILGYPVITSAYVPGDIIVLMDQDKILSASDPNVVVDVSAEASIQLDSVPTNPPAPLVSLWQQNMIGLRAEKFEYWMRANETCIVEITGVAYGSNPPGPPDVGARSNGNSPARDPNIPTSGPGLVGTTRDNPLVGQPSAGRAHRS